MFGHSMGGVTAGQFRAEDRRCKAGLNLDGIPQYGTMIDHSLRPPFLMVYSARPGRTGASDAIYRRGASPYVRVNVRDTLHLDFSDMVFWGGPLRERPILGKLAPERNAGITRATAETPWGTREFHVLDPDGNGLQLYRWHHRGLSYATFHG